MATSASGFQLASMIILLFQGDGSGGPEPPNHALIGISPLGGLDRPGPGVLNGHRTCADLDSARLHGLRHLAHQVDMQKPVVEGRAVDLDMVREAEFALERPRGDALENVVLLAVPVL